MQRQALSFQAIPSHWQLVHDAAKAKGLSIADYLRRVVLEWAASDLGQPPPDLSIYTPDLVAQAARKLGMSPREFSAKAVRDAAERAMGLDSLVRPSEIRAKAAAGGRK